MKKKILAVLLSSVLALSMMACGSNESTLAEEDAQAEELKEENEAQDDEIDEENEAQDAEIENADDEADDAGEASGDTPTLDAIKDAGKIILLTEATFPPYEYISGDGYAGIDIEIGEQIAERLDVELEVLDMNFDLLTDALNSDKGDFIAAGFTATPERAQVVDFTEPYILNGLMVILPADSEAASMDDLAGLKIGVQEGTTGHYLAEDNVDTAPDNILAYKSTIEAGAAVRTGKCDAAIVDKLPAESIVANSNGELKLMEGVYEEEETAIAVKKGNEDLLALIQEVLDELEESGKLQEYIDYHMEAAADE